MRFRCADLRTAVVLAKDLFFCPRRTAYFSPNSPLISPSPSSSLTTVRNTYTMVLAFQDPRDEVGVKLTNNALTESPIFFVSL